MKGLRLQEQVRKLKVKKQKAMEDAKERGRPAKRKRVAFDPTLEWAEARHIPQLEFRGDSQTVINWINGISYPKSILLGEHLDPILVALHDVWSA